MKPITRLTLAALLTTAVFGTALADTDFGSAPRPDGCYRG
jgi:hypothetical protein